MTDITMPAKASPVSVFLQTSMADGTVSYPDRLIWDVGALRKTSARKAQIDNLQLQTRMP